jgi:hypothetical protein
VEFEGRRKGCHHPAVRPVQSGNGTFNLYLLQCQIRCDCDDREEFERVIEGKYKGKENIKDSKG